METTDGTEETDNEEKKELTLEELLIELRENEHNPDSPINLNITKMRVIELPMLNWNHYETLPKKIKLTNSGHTVILSAKWFQERPYLMGGPLMGNYAFSQMHFHWGVNDMEGSEHTIDGTQYPVEMHVVHFKSTYLSQEAALYEKDGVAVVVYVLKLQSQANPRIQQLLDQFGSIQKAYTSVKLESSTINTFIPFFDRDYFMYWGEIKTTKKNHLIHWIICRTPIGISAEQVETFRTLSDDKDLPLRRNFREMTSTGTKLIYHVNASGARYSTLLPVARDSVAK